MTKTLNSLIKTHRSTAKHLARPAKNSAHQLAITAPFGVFENQGNVFNALADNQRRALDIGGVTGSNLYRFKVSL